MRNINRFYYGVLTVVMAFVLVTFASQAVEKKVKVYVSIVPQEYFVERVGGDMVEVAALVLPGDSPATYQPTPQQIAGLSSADLYFRIGVPFEKGFMPKIKGLSDKLKIIDTRKGITLRIMKAHHHHDGDDADTDESEHAGKDPHIWLNPMNIKIQAKTIADALIQVDPDGKDLYNENYKKFCTDLDKLNEQLAKSLEPVKGETLMVFHPAWGYFADQYGLKQEAIEIEGKNPSAKQLARMIDEAKKDNIRVIFVQPQFSKAAASNVAQAINGAVVAVNPLSKDYIDNLKAVANKIEAALSEQK